MSIVEVDIDAQDLHDDLAVFQKGILICIRTGTKPEIFTNELDGVFPYDTAAGTRFVIEMAMQEVRQLRKDGGRTGISVDEDEDRQDNDGNGSDDDDPGHLRAELDLIDGILDLN